MSFTGTQDKCNACNETVHFIDLLTADGVPYHKTCFKCSHCKGTLSMCSYSFMDGILYCKPHFEQLFKETGSFTKKVPSSLGLQTRSPPCSLKPRTTVPAAGNQRTPWRRFERYTQCNDELQRLANLMNSSNPPPFRSLFLVADRGR
ncbi:unnamed protein product [Musa hybrid cultivar]